MGHTTTSQNDVWQVNCGISSRGTALHPPVPRDLNHLVLYVFGEALLKRLSNHGDLVPGQKDKGSEEGSRD